MPAAANAAFNASDSIPQAHIRWAARLVSLPIVSRRLAACGCLAELAILAESTQQNVATSPQNHAASKASPEMEPPMHMESQNQQAGRTSGAHAWNDISVPSNVEEHSVLEMEGAERESPETRRVANKKTSRGGPGYVTDEITTIEDDEPDSPVKKKGWGEERESLPSKPANIPKPKPPPPRKPQEDSSYDDDRPSTLLTSISTKAKDAEVVTLSRPGDKAVNTDDETGLDDSLGLSRLAPTGMGRPPPPGGNKGYKAASPNRYDLDLSDDDDDKKTFDLERFCKFYKVGTEDLTRHVTPDPCHLSSPHDQWNKSKPADLLDFLWRNFDAKQYSMLCLTYKDQDSIFAGFQVSAEALIPSAPEPLSP